MIKTRCINKMSVKQKIRLETLIRHSRCLFNNGDYGFSLEGRKWKDLGIKVIELKSNEYKVMFLYPEFLNITEYEFINRYPEEYMNIVRMRHHRDNAIHKEIDLIDAANEDGFRVKYYTMMLRKMLRKWLKPICDVIALAFAFIVFIGFIFSLSSLGVTL